MRVFLEFLTSAFAFVLFITAMLYMLGSARLEQRCHETGIPVVLALTEATMGTAVCPSYARRL